MEESTTSGGSRKAVDSSISLQFTSLEQHLVGVKNKILKQGVGVKCGGEK
jgi:hypothetical protein